MANIEKKKVLLVDDDELFLKLYQKAAEEFPNIELTTAGGGADALAQLRGGYVPDIGLFDVTMAGTGGLDLIETIKKENLAPNARLVVLSNTNESPYIDRANALGIKDYIIKASRLPSEVLKYVSM